MPTQTLTYSPAEAVRAALVDLGFGVTGEGWNGTTAWPIYVSNEPALPDNCLTITDTQGTDDGDTMPDGECQVHHGFQVRVRSVDHRTGWTKADAIRRGLAQSWNQKVVHVSAANVLIHCFARMGQVLALGKMVPTNKNSLFTVNAVAAMTEL